MRAFNILLAVLISVLLAALVFEGGLRLIGLGPPVTLGQFDAQLGWVKTPNAKVHRHTPEFDVHFEINALGLRDDPMASPAKPAGTLRVLMLGDSFVQGYTVERKDLFVDLLENWWKAEGRAVDVVNFGTEGYSTDQEALWLAGQGRAFQPDVVLLFPYANDIYWNSATSYERYQKPRINPDGRPELRVLSAPAEKSCWEETATGTLVEKIDSLLHAKHWSPDGTRTLKMEDAAFFREPPEFMKEALLRTRGALGSIKETCEALHARLLVVPIPHMAAHEADERELFERKLGPGASPEQPSETFQQMCGELSIEVVDLPQRLQSIPDKLYFHDDFHFNPAGNRAVARVLHEELDKRGVFPAVYLAKNPAALPEPATESRGVPTWAFVFAGLWLAVGALYAATYRDEPAWLGFLKVGGMLALVFTIAIGGNALLSKLPARYALALTVMLVGGLVLFILYKLGRRLATTFELLVAFMRRGHWYLMPLVVVLLSIGSLLVVAASSPLIAPFIYTLF